MRNNRSGNTLASHRTGGQTQAPDIFISYSSLDKAVADRVYAALKQAGVRCWKAPESLMPGRSYPSQIIAAINQCRVMVFILSESSNASPQVLREVERAVHRDIILVPFRIEKVVPTSDLEYYLSVPHWLDAYEPPLEPHLETLTTTIAHLLGQDVDTTVGSRRLISSKVVATKTPKPQPHPVEIANGLDQSAPFTEASADNLGGGRDNSLGAGPVVPTVPGDGALDSRLSPKICPRCSTGYDGAMDFCPRDGSALRVRDSEKGLIGRIVADRYRVLRKMGQGGMGEVYLAEHVKMGRKCAIKMIHGRLLKDVDVVRRFGREAANASRITHPNVAAIYDFGEDEGAVYIAMEFVDGESLHQVITSGGAMSEDRAKDITCQVADALQAAHDEGVVHRDLKPDNIMIARGRSGRDIVKVVDFGIAKAIEADPEQEVTQTGLVVGTPRYMSPEQLMGDSIDARSDLYSLGSILFEMLTGSPAFAGPTGEVLLQRRTADLAPHPRTLRPALPKSLDDIVVKAMHPLPSERFSSAADFRDSVLQAGALDAAERDQVAREATEAKAAEVEAAGVEAAMAKAAETQAAEAREVEARAAEARAAEARAAEARAAERKAAEAKTAEAKEPEAEAAEARATNAKVESATEVRAETMHTDPRPEVVAGLESAPRWVVLPDAVPESQNKVKPRSRYLRGTAAGAIAVLVATLAVQAFPEKSSVIGDSPGRVAASSSLGSSEITNAVGGSLDAGPDSSPGVRAGRASRGTAGVGAGAPATGREPPVPRVNSGDKRAATVPPAPSPVKGGSPTIPGTLASKATPPQIGSQAPPGALPTASALEPRPVDLAPSTAGLAATVAPTITPSRNTTPPRRDMAAEVKDAAAECVGALRSNNSARIAQLYPQVSEEDRANRTKLLALMRRSESRLTVAGSPVIGKAEIQGESAHADFTARLAWRTNFGGRVERAVRFRAIIAPSGGESHIGCLIQGNANL